MTVLSSRRSILRGLTTLPLIGGGVTLVGSPTAAAVPLTGGMMATYIGWLEYERRLVSFGCRSKVPEDFVEFIPHCNPGANWHWDGEQSVEERCRQAQQRAPIVLAAVGCPLTSARADEFWKDMTPCA